MKHSNVDAMTQKPLGPLAFLSIQRTERGKTPMAPTNEDRIRAFRYAQPVFQANNYEWSFRHADAHADLSVALG